MLYFLMNTIFFIIKYLHIGKNYVIHVYKSEEKHGCSIFQWHTLFAKSRISLYKAFEGGDAVASLTENNAVEGNAGKQIRIVNW